MKTLYVIILTFNSWDECQDFAHDAGLYDMDQVEFMCHEHQQPNETAPSKSLRPKARTD